MPDIRLEELPENARVLVALSGGADSVALLHLCLEAAKAGRITLACAHMEHGIRGEESVGDMEFVRRLCESNGVPLFIKRVSALRVSEETKTGLEEAARSLRHAFLREIFEREHMDVIALAHHRDDQCETCLMHLFRGSGLLGVTGMRVRDGILWRPLLRVGKKDILEYLTKNGFSWREDGTNRVNDNPRNSLRNEILPKIRDIYPGCDEAVSRFSEIAAAENAFLEAMAREAAKTVCRGMPFGYRILPERTHPVLAARILHDLSRDMRQEDVKRALGVKPGETIQIRGFTVRRCEDRLYLILEDAIPNRESISPEGLFTLEECDAKPSKDPFCQVLDLETMRGAVLRNRRPGDMITPFGMRGAKTLQDYMIDKKLDRPLRDWLPIWAKENDVLWVPGLGISGYAALQKGSRGLKIRYLHPINDID